MTAAPAVKTGRNTSMECCKLVAAFFVIFNHAPLPGNLGKIIDCLGHFAVPMFFAISGYFNYQATGKQIRRRTWHIVKLLVIGTVAHLCYGCLATELNGGSTIAYLRAAIPDPIEVLNFIVLHKHPYAGHLWYLVALIACYLVFYAYTRFCETGRVNYRPFYILCLGLFCVTFALDTITSATSLEEVSFFARNGWFAGLPMFGFGLFLHQYQERIFRAFQLPGRKLFLLILAGAALSILQSQTTGIGMLPLGTLISVAALMLFLISHPKVPVISPAMERLVLSFGPISTWIYLLHLVFVLFYGSFCQPYFAALWGEMEPYLGPVLIAAVSLVTAVVCEVLSQAFRGMRKKRAK